MTDFSSLSTSISKAKITLRRCVEGENFDDENEVDNLLAALGFSRQAGRGGMPNDVWRSS
jgi:hypothetical protein